MKFVVYLLLILLLFSAFLLGEKIAALPEIGKNPGLMVNEKYIYITDGFNHTINVYTKQECRHSEAFGTKGEGPREFMSPPVLDISGNHLVAISMGKLTFLTLDGDFVREEKVPTEYQILKVTDSLLVARKTIQLEQPEGYNIMKARLLVLDRQFNELRQVHDPVKAGIMIIGRSNTKREMRLLPDLEEVVVSNDRIFVGNSEKGFHFSVYNFPGDNQFEIDHPYQKRQVTAADKKRILEERKRLFESRGFRLKWEDHLKRYSRLTFPDYFPPYQKFVINQDLLLVFEHKREDNRRNCYIFDQNGELIKQITLPQETSSFSSEFPSYLYGDSYYYILENEDEEQWELHSFKIE